jgi:hypothetical protein
MLLPQYLLGDPPFPLLLLGMVRAETIVVEEAE